MLKIGITGGIGTGKSFVSKIFRSMGIPFYDADKEAKRMMNTNVEIRDGLIAAFGSMSYTADGTLNRKWLSDTVFTNPEKLAVLNAIVHPVVIQDAIDWNLTQNAVYTLKEAALLFESGSYKSLDFTILVTAPPELRIHRVMERDQVTREQVLSRMSKQMPEDDKLAFADFRIVNDEVSPLLPQVMAIHQQLISQ